MGAPTPPPARRARPVAITVTAAVATAVAVVAAVVVTVVIRGSGDDVTASAPPAAAPPATPPTKAVDTYQCAWTPAPAEVMQVRPAGTPTRYVPDTGSAVMTLTTSRGVIEVTMDVAATPCTVASFAHLAAKGFLTGSGCHRLTTDALWILQCGDPTGSGSGGPDYEFGEENLPEPTPSASGSVAVVPEPAERVYPRGSVATANAGMGSNGAPSLELVLQTVTVRYG